MAALRQRLPRGSAPGRARIRFRGRAVRADGSAQGATGGRQRVERHLAETLDLEFVELGREFHRFIRPQGRKVDPGKIRRTALLTVEGGRDDICSLGQTAAAHDLCNSLRPHLKRHHLQANVGHYGTFNGKRWENEIYPAVRNFIMAME